MQHLKKRDGEINENPEMALTPELLSKFTTDFDLKSHMTSTKSELMQNTLLVQQDEKVINMQLYGRIKDNIGKFHDSFNNLEQLKQDMTEAKVKTMRVKESAQRLKKLQLQNLVKVQRLN